MLIETFCQIAIPGSAVHYRRCSEVKTTVQTINQLTEARSTELRRLLSEAFIRFFLQLPPRNFQTLNGKRHVHTAHFKLYKS